MKKINLLAVALAAFTMFSCSNEEIADLGSNAPGEKATLTIKVEGEGNNVAQSRAIGTTTTDVTINNYIVFLSVRAVLWTVRLFIVLPVRRLRSLTVQLLPRLLM